MIREEKSFFDYVTSKVAFKEHVFSLLEELKGKRVLLYGFGKGFEVLNGLYNIANAIDIVAIADKKFCVSRPLAMPVGLENSKLIEPNDIVKEDFDVILISNLASSNIVGYLLNSLKLVDKDIRSIFNPSLVNDLDNYKYLQERKFLECLKYYSKKLRNKRVMVYGTGLIFNIMYSCYDLSSLNIIGVSDSKYTVHKANEMFHGFRVYAPKEMKNAKPDCVLVTTKFYTDLIFDLCTHELKGTGIKVYPFIRKPFFTILKEKCQKYSKRWFE